MADFKDSNETGFHTPAVSLYMDVLRFGAAFVVVLSHMSKERLLSFAPSLANYGHDAVIVFFVLSGYVIAHSTLSRRRTARAYFSARLSRIYSVAAPAIAFSVGLYLLWSMLDPQSVPAEGRPDTPVAWTALSSLVFLNENWGLRVMLPLNGPYWSLCYEAWYYALFGVFVFLRGHARIAAMGVAAVFAGIDILLLLPIWVAGAWLHVRGSRAIASLPLGLALIVASVALYILVQELAIGRVVWNLLRDAVPGAWRISVYARDFATDYGIGFAVIVNLLAFTALAPVVGRWLVRGQRAIRFAASCTFSIYLFHRPLVFLLGAYAPNTDGSHLHSAVGIVLILGTCVLLATVTEHKLPAWRGATDRLLDRFAPSAAR